MVVFFLRRLHEEFWDTLHPQMEEADTETRAAALDWLDDKISEQICFMPLTMANKDQTFSLWDWKEATILEQLRRRRDLVPLQQAMEDGKRDLEVLERIAACTSLSYYERLFAELCEARQEVTKLGKTIELKYDKDAPSLQKIEAAISECESLLDGIMSPKRNRDAGLSSLPEQFVRSEITESIAANTIPSADPTNRADAIRRLHVVAEFFRKTEPQSPVVYAIERAIKWSEMPLEEWLCDVISDRNILNHVRSMLGLARERESNDS